MERTARYSTDDQNGVLVLEWTSGPARACLRADFRAKHVVVTRTDDDGAVSQVFEAGTPA